MNQIAKCNGFTPFLINTRTTTEYTESHTSRIRGFLYDLRKIFILLRSVLSIKSGSLVLLQYPFSPFGEFFTLFFCRCLKMKKCHLVILIHDIINFRMKEQFDKTETNIFNTASELIVHTPQMRKLLKENGIIRPSKLLWLFDYLTDEVPSEDPHHFDAKSIAFAGAAGKSSHFLNKIKVANYTGVQLHLYGRQPDDTAEYPEWMKYIGRFSPENITMLAEGWGLTWDGDGVDTLCGPLGDYLKYNSSHKTSLYIAAGIPVVVSKESALADYVEKNKLGITISSLLDLDRRITEFDQEELQDIRKHVAEMSKVLRTGGMLGAVLQSILEEIDA